MGNISGRPAVVVAGAYRTGVALMRTLARHGVASCCTDWNPAQHGFRTVHGKGYVCPNPDTHLDAWAAFMVELAGRFPQPPVLIPTADQFVAAIAARAGALAPHYVFRPKAAVLQGELATKERQYALAAQFGMPAPRAAFAQTAGEVQAFAAQALFPCVMKPTRASEWERLPQGHPVRGRKTMLARDAEELAAIFQQVAELFPGVSLQEMIAGPDTAKLVYLSCYGEGSRLLGNCVVREVRTQPIEFGSATLVEPVDDPETAALCDRFLRAAGYEGICEIELKRDTRDGQVKLIEVNPRFSGTADAGPHAGVDTGWLHYQDMIGARPALARWHGRGFRHMVLERDAAGFRSYMDAGLLTWGGLLRSYWGARYFDVELRDWRLTLETLNNAARALAHPAYRKLFPKRLP